MQQTKCPQCQSCFTFTEEQVQAASGKVRCGHCLVVFHAKAHLVSSAPPSIDSAVAAASISEKSASVEAESKVLARSVRWSDQSKTDISNFSSDTSGSTGLSDQPASEEKIVEQSALNAAKNQHNMRYTAPDLPPLAKQAGRLVALSSIISPAIVKDIFIWLPLSIFLLLSLICQYMWVNFAEFAGKPSWRGAYQTMCYLFDCQLPGKKDIAPLRAEQLKVAPTDQETQTRRLEARLTNHSYMVKALPAIIIHFKDINDNPLASGYYTPTQYLPYQQKTLEPNQFIDISLTFMDPGEAAINYSLEIIEP